MKALNYIFAIALIISVVGNLALHQALDRADKENKVLSNQVNTLTFSLSTLSEEFKKLSARERYSISLAPTISSKVTSTFGSTKNVTLQYFFTMDGNRLEIKPDSVYQVSRIDD